MSFYFKSLEELNENHGLTSSEAPVTGMDESLATALKSATDIALIEDYLRCAMHHHAFESTEAMIAFTKELCSAALDNGDLSAADAEHIFKWIEVHRMEIDRPENMQEKFIKHVCAEEVCEVLDDRCDEYPDFSKATQIRQACEQMGKDMSAKYGQIILKTAGDFIRLYGKYFDDKFKAHFVTESPEEKEELDAEQAAADVARAEIQE